MVSCIVKMYAVGVTPPLLCRSRTGLLGVSIYRVYSPHLEPAAGVAGGVPKGGMYVAVAHVPLEEVPQTLRLVGKTVCAHCGHGEHCEPRRSCVGARTAVS